MKEDHVPLTRSRRFLWTLDQQSIKEDDVSYKGIYLVCNLGYRLYNFYAFVDLSQILENKWQILIDSLQYQNAL